MHQSIKSQINWDLDLIQSRFKISPWEKSHKISLLKYVDIIGNPLTMQIISQMLSSLKARSADHCNWVQWTYLVIQVSGKFVLGC